MDLDFYLSPPPIMREKKKYATFTVRAIGGPEEIVKWRAEQAIKEANYKIKLTERDARLAAFEAETNQKLDTPTIHTTSWEEKYAFAREEQVRLKTVEKIAADSYSYTPFEEPKKTIIQKIKGFFSNLWTHSNF